MTLIDEYFELTQKYKSEYGEKTMLLMQVGAFFECYALKNKTTRSFMGSEIAEFSKVCDLNIADKKICSGIHNVFMAGFGVHLIDKYLKKLQEVGFTIVVYTQDEQKTNTTRSLAGIYSPGTYFSQETTQITNNTTCIWVQVVDISTSPILKKMFPRDQKLVHVGLANIDIYTGKTSIFEFKEIYIKNPTTFDEMERFLSIYQPNEVILIGNVWMEELDEILSYGNVQCASVHKIPLIKFMEPEPPLGPGLQTKDKKKQFKEFEFEFENPEPKKPIAKARVLPQIIQRAFNCEKQIYQKEIIEKFYKTAVHYEGFKQNFYENTVATQAFCFLLDFIYQHNPYLVNKISEPLFENCSDRLTLANHSLKQLNIIEDKQDNGKYSSVEKVLNLCWTSMGKRRFSYQLLNPTTQVPYLEKEYAITEHLLSQQQTSPAFEYIPTALQEIKDISKINRQIVMKKISPKSLYFFHSNLKTIRDLFEKIQQDTCLAGYLREKIPAFASVATYCSTLIALLEDTMVLDLCEDMDTFTLDTNIFKKNVDSDLDAKTKTLAESTDKLECIRIYFNELISKYEKKGKGGTTDYVKYHETDKGSQISFVSTQRRCALLKQCFGFGSEKNASVSLPYVSSYDNTKKVFEFSCSDAALSFHPHSTSNSESISNPQIHELCQNISCVKSEMKDLLARVYLNAVVHKLGEFQDSMETIIEFVTRVDVIYTKAAIAKKYNYCKPKIVPLDSTKNKKAYFNARGLRHSLIEHIQQTEVYVTNDLDIGMEKDGHLIYGTNAVGKTSLIRAVGIIVILAQAGLYVPCSHFEYYPYTCLFTRILGNDNIFKGLSTFAVEMSELRTILRLADRDSLILGNELCSGTESISAKSIFVAGIQQLAAKRCSFLFATHLHEITGYEEITSLNTLSLKHLEVIYDRERDALVYDRKLKDGPGNTMYGLEVCKSLSLPDDFLELANGIRMKYHPESASLLSLKTSHFNSKKLMHLCHKCHVALAKEMHHITQQKDADEDGFIHKEDGAVFHKNHEANLQALCEKCHNEIHHHTSLPSTTNTPISKIQTKVKTKTKGPKKV